MRNSIPDIYSEIIKEKNDRIRKLEIVILTLAEADPELHNIQHLAKQALISYNIFIHRKKRTTPRQRDKK